MTRVPYAIVEDPAHPRRRKITGRRGQRLCVVYGSTPEEAQFEAEALLASIVARNAHLSYTPPLDLAADLDRRAASCRALNDGGTGTSERLEGKAAAYAHAAEMVRAAAVADASEIATTVLAGGEYHGQPITPSSAAVGAEQQRRYGPQGGA